MTINKERRYAHGCGFAELYWMQVQETTVLTEVITQKYSFTKVPYLTKKKKRKNLVAQQHEHINNKGFLIFLNSGWI